MHGVENGKPGRVPIRQAKELRPLQSMRLEELIPSRFVGVSPLSCDPDMLGPRPPNGPSGAIEITDVVFRQGTEGAQVLRRVSSETSRFSQGGKVTDEGDKGSTHEPSHPP